MNTEFAGAPTVIDTNPDHLARLKAVREKKPGVYELTTYPSGIHFDLSKPRECDVRIEDIAHALSMMCRFGGHVPRFYSVAQHSVLVGAISTLFGLPGEHWAAALLHDAHEAYCNDLISPAKRLAGRSYTNVADDVQACIHRALGLPKLNAHAIDCIKKADKAAFEAEQAAIARGNMIVRIEMGNGNWIDAFPMCQEDAKQYFLGSWLNKTKEPNCPVGQPRQRESHSAVAGS